MFRGQYEVSIEEVHSFENLVCTKDIIKLIKTDICYILDELITFKFFDDSVNL